MCHFGMCCTFSCGPLWGAPRGAFTHVTGTTPQPLVGTAVVLFDRGANRGPRRVDNLTRAELGLAPLQPQAQFRGGPTLCSSTSETPLPRAQPQDGPRCQVGGGAADVVTPGMQALAPGLLAQKTVHPVHRQTQISSPLRGRASPPPVRRGERLMELTSPSRRPGPQALPSLSPCLLSPEPLTQLGPSWATVMSPEAGLVGKWKWGLLSVPFRSGLPVT